MKAVQFPTSLQHTWTTWKHTGPLSKRNTSIRSNAYPEALQPQSPRTTLNDSAALDWEDQLQAITIITTHRGARKPFKENQVMAQQTVVMQFVHLLCDAEIENLAFPGKCLAASSAATAWGTSWMCAASCKT